jgi:tetratricopeptide (TPR) repeat protein
LALKVRPEIHDTVGNALAGLKRPAEAIPHFEQALALEPKDPNAALGLGRALLALGRQREAETALCLCIELAPESADAHDELARLLADLGRTSEAERHYQAACQCDLKEPLFPMNFGTFYARRKQFDLAIHWYRQSLARQPDFAQSQLQLGIALYEQGDLAAASKAALALLRLKPNSKAGHELIERIAAARRG